MVIKGILRFLFILFLEIGCGITLAFLYWIVSSLLFDDHGFGRSRVNEGIHYAVILLPPFAYCLVEFSRRSSKGDKNNSSIYLAAGIIYLLGGLFFMLILTDFYLLGN